MNYNGYYPSGGYQYQNPYYQQYQPVQQMFPTQMSGTSQAPVQTQTQAPVQSNPSTIIWVNGEKEAAMFPVSPNSAVALWDSANPVIFLKQADASGKPTMRTYDLVERVEAAQNASLATGVDVSAFAAKSDLAAVAGAVGAMQKDIDAIKEEMGNLASQAVKRAVGAKAKKELVQEDEE